MKKKVLIMIILMFNLILFTLTSCTSQNLTKELTNSKLIKNEDLLFLPIPRKINYGKGTFILKPNFKISCKESDMLPILGRLKNILFEYTGKNIQISEMDDNCKIFFIRNKDIPFQGYKIIVNKAGIQVEYNDKAGAFYAVSTLKQLIEQCKENVPFLDITDDPDIQNRGILIDISRDKIPKIETIYKIIDMMADMKLNQLQLYIEGFSFAYPSFPDVWKNGTPITSKELKLIGAYCTERFIDFVPNQNSYGHMDAWMNRPEFKKYAECPDGYINEAGVHANPGTLGLTDPEAVKFLDKLYQDFLPNFSSEYVNIGGDETYEVGLGKGAAIKEKSGAEGAYLAGLLNVYNLAKTYNKKIMFWGDIVMKYPELVSKLPKDIIPMEWGYEWDSSFKEDTKKFSEAGLKYYVCPGTSSWNSILGRTDNMLANIYNAVSNGLANGAAGVLTCDWGDGGTWQYLPISYAGYSYTAAVSWCVNNNKDVDIGRFMSRFIFKDKNEQLGTLLMNIGNNYKHMHARMWNQTWLNAMATMPYTESTVLLPNFTNEECKEVANDLEAFIEDLKTMHLMCSDADIVVAELKNGARLLLNTCNYSIIRLDIAGGKAVDEALRKKAATLNNDLKGIVEEHKRLWLLRNKYSGLDDSANRMMAMSTFYETLIK
jgi:hexosaminidase